MLTAQGCILHPKRPTGLHLASINFQPNIRTAAAAQGVNACYAPLRGCAHLPCQSHWPCGPHRQHQSPVCCHFHDANCSTTMFLVWAHMAGSRRATHC